MNDAKLTSCPQAACDGAVRRLLGTGAGLIFKGSGFYQTDYRSDSYNSGSKSEGEKAAPAAASSPAAAAPAAAASKGAAGGE